MFKFSNKERQPIDLDDDVEDDLSKKQVEKNRRGSEIMIRIQKKKEILEYKDCIRSKMDSILAQKQSTEMLIDNAISDFPLDRDLRIMSRELQSMFGQEDTSTGDAVNNETQIHLFQTPKKTAKGSKKRMEKKSRDMEKTPIQLLECKLYQVHPWSIHRSGTVHELIWN
ncbi:hypothetical protein Ccrd_013165 [Cynara cardunculus var. scolymus]|uniref:Uncharacterized protein n=1 Tax=Cynara cardunculus var. scolymus TaxID=59895 RepID=A0A118K532_CYNCS|nr:hypothetical protein Ccrd_013165 [Cynara cardunculus var. scolymus]